MSRASKPGDERLAYSFARLIFTGRIRSKYSGSGLLAAGEGTRLVAVAYRGAIHDPAGDARMGHDWEIETWPIQLYEIDRFSIMKPLGICDRRTTRARSDRRSRWQF